MITTMKNVLRIQNLLLGQCEHEVTVRRIGNGWNCRVFTNGQLNQESRVENRSEIGFACREMLRWEDKCGNISKFAMAARQRHNERFN